MTLLLTTGGLTIATGAVVFLSITLVLVGALLFAKAKLLPSGNVTMTVNGEKTYSVPLGGTVLSTLQNAGIFLSSACGGSGSCGQCRCRIPEGGGTILPTETGFFSRRQIQDSWRLGCQTKIKEDIQIVVPQEVFGVKQWECTVLSNRNVASFIKEFTVQLPPGETMNFQPGSYAQISIPKYQMTYRRDIAVEEPFLSEWDKFNLWNLACRNNEPTVRAYSMANYPAEGNIITLNVRIATPPFDRRAGAWQAGILPGIASSYIFSRKPGDKVLISGPYGEFHILNSQREMLYIGGGAGMAPLRSHLLHLFKTLRTSRKVSFWYGARSKAEIFYENDFRDIERDFPNFSFHIALSEPRPEDQWTGHVGFIHQVILDNYLAAHEAPEDIEYYMCGPGPMSNAVKQMLDNLGVPPSMLLFDDFGA